MLAATGIMPRAGPKKPARLRLRRKAAVRPRRKSVRAGAQHETETALASLAHDIRTPLTGILALAELLAASELGERERKWAIGIRSAGEHLARLTTVVCDAVKSGAVGLTLQREAFSPRLLAETVAASLSARARLSGLSIETAIGEFPATVIGDPVRLRAALENLIDNAVKFTARGGIRFEASAKPDGKKVRLTFSVSDTGAGLTRAEIARLFRPFAQASKQVSRRYGGTGLGLALVKRLARAMGGDLKVRSKPGRGSTFVLGVNVEKNSAKMRTGAPGEAAGAPLRKLNVLCVEDNPYGRVILNAIMTELGHNTEFAGSGEAALAALKRGSFDLVLMDVELTGIDGVETTRLLRALPGVAGRIAVIGISGTPEARQRALAAGMNDYLEKPISPAALVAALQRLFGP